MSAASRNTPGDGGIEAIFAAAGADCPSPETYHRMAIGELAPERCEELRRHAAECPMCAVELELAHDFAAGPDPAQAGALREDLAAIRERLDATAPHRPAAAPQPSMARGRVLRFPARLGSPALLLAAAALALTVGLGVRSFLPDPGGAEAPPLPLRPAAGVERSTAVRGLVPAGELDAVPRHFTWTAVEGAESYRLVLLAVDDSALWETEVAAPPVELDPAVIQLSPAVLYAWRVEALDTAGRSLARSERVGFRVRPEPEAEPPAEPSTSDSNGGTGP